MKVRELMQTNLKTINYEDGVNDAVVALTDSHVSGLPVINGAGHMVGVISSTDILTTEAEARDAVEREALFEQMLVRDIMTPRPLTISPDAEVREAAQQMLYADIHRLFVTRGDHLIGVISTTDIVRAVAAGQI
jgi:CIC family chloride channel protein